MSTCYFFIIVRGFTLLVLPMKLKKGSGAPLRIMAVPWTLIKDD